MTVLGECVVTAVGDRLRVDRADPEIVIAPEFLDEIRAGRHHEDVHLVGDLLRIEALNRRVVYRVGEMIPDRRGYYAAWPD